MIKKVWFGKRRLSLSSYNAVFVKSTNVSDMADKNISGEMTISPTNGVEKLGNQMNTLKSYPYLILHIKKINLK